MISSHFKDHIAQALGSLISKVNTVTGGDISKAYCVHTSSQRFFLKVNESAIALEMFLAEKKGLENINLTKTIKAPEVIHCGQHESSSYLLLEFIASKNPTSKEFEALGHQLADLHTFYVGDSFGWKQDNYIGSLPQSNKNYRDWTLFYVHERLLPQLKMAKEKGLLDSNEIPSESNLVKFVKHSREKKNMELMIMAELGYDKKDPINAGVQNYELVGCSAGVTVHRVVYKCPISGETYSFVTSLTNVPPGLIAYLYKTRWDIEKIFDQVKNKLVEKKAWATSDTAKNMQAQFICIAHNLYTNTS
jgi:hypothetical protein